MLMSGGPSGERTFRFIAFVFLLFRLVLDELIFRRWKTPHAPCYQRAKNDRATPMAGLSTQSRAGTLSGGFFTRSYQAPVLRRLSAVNSNFPALTAAMPDNGASGGSHYPSRVVLRNAVSARGRHSRGALSAGRLQGSRLVCAARLPFAASQSFSRDRQPFFMTPPGVSRATHVLAVISIAVLSLSVTYILTSTYIHHICSLVYIHLFTTSLWSAIQGWYAGT